MLPDSQLFILLQDDSCTWSPEQLQMAVGSPLIDYAQEAALARAESADSPGTNRTLPCMIRLLGAHLCIYSS